MDFSIQVFVQNLGFLFFHLCFFIKLADLCVKIQMVVKLFKSKLD